MEEEVTKAPSENRMGTMPVFRLLLTVSAPMMLSMLVQALYNVVDSIFVSRVSEAALTAVSVAFPIQNLMIAVAGGLGVGMNALLSRALGEKKFDRADHVAMQGIMLEVVSCLIFMICGFTLMKAYMRSQTNDADIIAYGTQYLTIVCGLSVGIFTEMTFERLLQATGRSFYSMITQGTGAVINIIMDPLLIFGIGPFPELGIRGAACATVMGQLVAAGLAVYFNIKKNPEVHFRRKYIGFYARTIKDILVIAIPSILMVSVGSVMNYLINQILFRFSSTVVAVFGAYYRVQSFIFMPVFGLNNGLVPIVSYNYGARYRQRMNRTIIYSIAIAVAIMLIGFSIFQIFPSQLLGLFEASEDMMDIGVVAFRTISLSFLLAGINVVGGSVCQALGKSVYSLIVSVVRQLVVLVPVAWLLARTGVVSNVWWAWPIAEVVALILTVTFILLTLRSLKWPESATE